MVRTMCSLQLLANTQQFVRGELRVGLHSWLSACRLDFVFAFSLFPRAGEVFLRKLRVAFCSAFMVVRRAEFFEPGLVEVIFMGLVRCVECFASPRDGASYLAWAASCLCSGRDDRPGSTCDQVFGHDLCSHCMVVELCWVYSSALIVATAQVASPLAVFPAVPAALAHC